MAFLLGKQDSTHISPMRKPVVFFLEPLAIEGIAAGIAVLLY